jgi:hypothetical protein
MAMLNGHFSRSIAMRPHLACLMVLFATPVFAETQSETLFSHKNWEVEVARFDDGSVACLAQVDDTTDSFTIWTYADQSMQLQFYSDQWEFGEGETADLEVQIDRRGPWSLTDAELYKQSVLFNLPDSKDGVRFLVEVAQGSRLHLSSADGAEVMWYSLAGSRASMDALIQCGEVITGGGKNPFK